ncbi:MAG: hypothetical protein KBT47_02145, partial [Armatimonadetes bacterium]|nr:hypothetical protein [Candidatus Hippobium faecium]
MKKITLTIILILLTASLFADILSDYVYKPDPSYKYTVTEKNTEENAKVVVAEMTSQTWQNTPITNTVVMIYPKNSKITDTAVLLNTGG